MQFEIDVEYQTDWENARLDVYVMTASEDGRCYYTALSQLDPALEESARFFTEGQTSGAHTFAFTYTSVETEGQPYVFSVMMQPVMEDAQGIYDDPSFFPPTAPLRSIKPPYAIFCAHRPALPGRRL